LALPCALSANYLRAEDADFSDVPPPSSPAPELNHDQHVDVRSYPALRDQVLNMISGAKQRIWLSTDYLTDGEICAALFVAQYRKIDVQVLLNKKKAHQYMSRLKYLKDQNIPVYFKPVNFANHNKAAMLVDERLVTVDAELDFLAKAPGYQLSSSQNQSKVEAFANAFAEASAQKLQAVPHPLPLVGRAGSRYPESYYRGSESAPGQVPSRPATGSVSYYGDQDGGYNYDRAQKSYHAPEGVARKLPKTTVLQERAKRPRPVREEPVEAPANTVEPQSVTE